MTENSVAPNTAQSASAPKTISAAQAARARPAAAAERLKAAAPGVRRQARFGRVPASAGAAASTWQLQHCESCPYRAEGREGRHLGKPPAATEEVAGVSSSPYGLLLQRENEKWIQRQPPRKAPRSKAAAGEKPKPKQQPICRERRCRLWSDLRAWFGYGKTDLSDVDYCAAFLPLNTGGIGLYEKLVELGRKTLETFAERYFFHQFALYAASSAAAAYQKAAARGEGTAAKTSAAAAAVASGGLISEVATAACRLGRGVFPAPPPLPKDLRLRVRPVTPQLLFVEKHVERAISPLALYLFGSCYLAAAQDGHSTREKIADLVLACTGFSCCSACGPEDEESSDDADPAAAAAAGAAPPHVARKAIDKRGRGGQEKGGVSINGRGKDEGPWMTIKSAAAAERLSKKISAATVKFSSAAFAASAQAHLWLATLLEHCYWSQRLCVGRTAEESNLLQDLHEYFGYEEETLSPELEDYLSGEVMEVHHGAAAADGAEILRVHALEYLEKCFPQARDISNGETARDAAKAEAAAAAEAAAWAAKEWQRLRQACVLELFVCTYLSLFPFLGKEDSQEADEPVAAALLPLLSPPAGYEVEAVHIRESAPAARLLPQDQQSPQTSAALLLPPSGVFVSTFLAILSACWRTQPEEESKIWMTALIERIRQVQVTQDLVVLDEDEGKREEEKHTKDQKKSKTLPLRKLATLQGLQRMRQQYSGSSNLLRKYLLWQQAEMLALLTPEQQQLQQQERLVPTAEALALFPITQEMQLLQEEAERRRRQQQEREGAAAGPGDLVIMAPRTRFQQYQRSGVRPYAGPAVAVRFPSVARDRVRTCLPHLWRLVDSQGNLKYELLLAGGPDWHRLELQEDALQM